VMDRSGNNKNMVVCVLVGQNTHCCFWWNFLHQEPGKLLGESSSKLYPLRPICVVK
jgi:hypothetical protein